MHVEQLKSSLAAVHQALNEVERADPELEQLLLQLHGDIQALTDPDQTLNARTDYSGRLRSFEAQLSIAHPQVAALLRSLVTTLEHLGI